MSITITVCTDIAAPPATVWAAVEHIESHHEYVRDTYQREAALYFMGLLDAEDMGRRLNAIYGAAAGNTSLGTVAVPYKALISDGINCAIAAKTTAYTATATDKAGNTATAHGSYRLLNIYVQGTSYSAGAFTLRAGHSYTVVVTDRAGRPTYYDAALYPHKPNQRDMAFNGAGHHRWTLGVALARSMRRRV